MAAKFSGLGELICQRLRFRKIFVVISDVQPAPDFAVGSVQIGERVVVG